MKANILLTPPVLEPVGLDELKNFARIEDSGDDDLLASLIAAARQWAEAYTRRAFLGQTWALYLSGPPRGDRISLPRGPLLAVTSVQIFDENDVATDWNNANYYADATSVPGALVLRSGACWPVPGRAANGIVVTYRAGYGEAAACVPEPLRLAVKQLALHWYENRGEALISATYARPPLTIEALLNPYRVLGGGGACG